MGTGLHFKGLPVKCSIIPSIILGRDDLGQRRAGNPGSRSRNTPHPGMGEGLEEAMGNRPQRECKKEDRW